jgi:hypothetical protein
MHGEIESDKHIMISQWLFCQQKRGQAIHRILDSLSQKNENVL